MKIISFIRDNDNFLSLIHSLPHLIANTNMGSLLWVQRRKERK